MDMKIKSARYVDKSNTICQEFYFTHPLTKATMNGIYNGHFTGSQLWKIDSPEYNKVLSTYNKSIKNMYDLPWATHRYLIEPITERNHVSRTLVERYMSFIAKVRNSKKANIRQLLEIIKRDTRTTTGFNLRTIMILSKKNSIEELFDDNNDFEYHPVDEREAWRIPFIKELIGVRHGDLKVDGMTPDELGQILDYICTT